MSKTIQLHCPSTKRTVANFVITPFQSNDQILQGIRLALQIQYAALYTADARSLTKLDALQNDQRVLVGASREEVMLPDSPAEFAFYDGQEGPDAEEWEWASEREKCAHVVRLNEEEPRMRNKLRITRAWEAIEEEMKMVGRQRVDAKECEGLIEQRWGTNIDHFLPDAMKPAKVKPSASKFWDEGAVAGLAVLSSFTQGQARLAAEFLEEAVQLRIGDGIDTSPVLQFQDVFNAVYIIFERAGVIKEKLTKPKSAKAREKERKKALKEKTKKEKSGAMAEK
ncbi:hypothetical protein HBI12_053550 [Parastagonospora nodorum]|nr:hypothetical protein HBI12_053550 [Parastagonospora nodorum]KAH5433738.1 hypothetical protein HBI47_088050 [Parastagonospora nodorum]